MIPTLEFDQWPLFDDQPAAFMIISFMLNYLNKYKINLKISCGYNFYGVATPNN